MKKILFCAIFFSFICNLKSNVFELEVEFAHDSIKLGGTLTLPDTIGKFPAVLLITGSGLQNRDEEIFGFKIFKNIAEHLTNNGFAVLRYDDRGVGKSKNKKKDLVNCNTLDFAKDAYSGIEFLKAHQNINSSSIGLLGHSEGGIISAILAAEHPDEINCIVLMAGPAIKGSEVINSQIITSNRAAGMIDKAIEIAINYQNRIYNALKNDLSQDEIKEIIYQSNMELIDYFPEAQKNSIANREEYSRSVANLSVGQVISPWFKFFVLFEPADVLAKVQCPTLALFGEKDSQVNPSLNIEPLRQAFVANPSLLTIHTIPSANHLFQIAIEGSVAEYSKLKKEFTPEFLPTIVNWLVKNQN